MDIEHDVTQDPSPETEVAPVEEVASEGEKTPTPVTPTKVTEKTVPYQRFKEVAEKAKRLEQELKTATPGALDVEDYIGISAALDGLDQREKEYLAQQHKLSGLPLKELRASEDFSFWQASYRAKVEKENKTLAPSSTQPDSERPKNLAQKLKDAKDLTEKETILREAGLYKENRPRADRAIIGKGW